MYRSNPRDFAHTISPNAFAVLAEEHQEEENDEYDDEEKKGKNQDEKNVDLLLACKELLSVCKDHDEVVTFRGVEWTIPLYTDEFEKKFEEDEAKFDKEFEKEKTKFEKEFGEEKEFDENYWRSSDCQHEMAAIFVRLHENQYDKKEQKYLDAFKAGLYLDHHFSSFDKFSSFDETIHFFFELATNLPRFQADALYWSARREVIRQMMKSDEEWSDSTFQALNYACLEGSSRAMYLMAEGYHAKTINRKMDNNKESNETKAIQWYTKAADLGHEYALKRLIKLYRKGWANFSGCSDVPYYFGNHTITANVNLELAHQYSLVLAARKDFEEIKNVIDYYKKMEDFVQANYWLEQGADATLLTDNPDIFFIVKMGKSLQKNPNQAIKYYERAMAKNVFNSMTCYELGCFYELKNNLTQARNVFEKGAIHKDKDNFTNECCFKMAKYCLQGWGGEKNDKESLAWSLRAL